MSGAAVCLIGLRCAGKSTVGRALAERLGRRFVDLDEVLAERGGRASAGALLAAVGEGEFRELETLTLSELLATEEPLVVATGGGCVESPGSRHALSAARTFWLDAPVEVLAARLRADPTPRPSLTGADPAEELAVLARRRRPLYEGLSEARLDATRPVAELAGEIAERLASDASDGR